MEINEKKKKKEQQEVIIRKYQQYLKLEKSLSPNTLDAYLTDLYKLINFLEQNFALPIFFLFHGLFLELFHKKPMKR